MSEPFLYPLSGYEDNPARVLEIKRDYYARRSSLKRAIREDAKYTAVLRGDPDPGTSTRRAWGNALHLLWDSDDFLGVCIHRLASSLYHHGVPILPRVLRRLNTALFNIRIDEHITIREGLCMPHGNVVLAGVTYVGRRAFIAPWVTIGLVEGDFLGPRLGDGVFVGTGAKILGPITIGDGARIGAGAVVLSDVPAGVSVAGVPARPLRAPTTVEGQ